VKELLFVLVQIKDIKKELHYPAGRGSLTGGGGFLHHSLQRRAADTSVGWMIRS